ncbi:uncharacterized protein LOC143231826 isoform X7 [Tachypleus tridentatus]|uniref:uncharacterized protein LOC143231826 isoform X7 n=1 Tax=Tachypleus tridentatus TaxID=6853 RepID=UPI003FD293AE
MLMSHLPGTIEYWASSSLYQIKIRRVFLLVIFVWKRKMSSSSFMKTRDSNFSRQCILNVAHGSIGSASRSINGDR